MLGLARMARGGEAVAISMNRSLRSFVACASLLIGGGALTAGEAAIGGYCPVAYVKAKMAVKGDPQYTSADGGLVYQFSSPEAKKIFDREPAKYRVAYDGWCATGVAMGKKIASDPTIFTVHEGATYLFSSAEVKAAFDKDPEMMTMKASAAWSKLK